MKFEQLRTVTAHKSKYRHRPVYFFLIRHWQIYKIDTGYIVMTLLSMSSPVAYPGIFFFVGGGSTNSVEDRGQRGRGSGGGSPLVRGSGGSCNLVQEISLHMVKFS